MGYPRRRAYDDKPPQKRQIIGGTLLAALIGMVAIIGSAFIIGRAISHNGSKADTALTDASQAKFVAQEIQRGRFIAALDSCNASNHRHSVVVSRLRDVISRLTDGQKDQALAQEAPTLLILDAIVPLRSNCKAYADRIIAEKIP